MCLWWVLSFSEAVCFCSLVSVAGTVWVAPCLGCREPHTGNHDAAAACSALPPFLLRSWSSAGRFLELAEQRWSFCGAACQPQDLFLRQGQLRAHPFECEIGFYYYYFWCTHHFIYMRFHLPLYYQVTYSHNIFLLFFTAACLPCLGYYHQGTLSLPALLLSR